MILQFGQGSAGTGRLFHLVSAGMVSGAGGSTYKMAQMGAQVGCWPEPWFSSTWLAWASHGILVSGEVGFSHGAHRPLEGERRSCQAFLRLRPFTGKALLLFHFVI